MIYFGLCWILRLFIRVIIISWWILVSFRGFFWELYFCMVKYLNKNRVVYNRRLCTPISPTHRPNFPAPTRRCWIFCMGLLHSWVTNHVGWWFFEAVPVLFWLLDRLYRIITNKFPFSETLINPPPTKPANYILPCPTYQNFLNQHLYYV